jgi:hypothetical protein
MSDCGAYCLFIGQESESKNVKSLKKYMTNKDILKEKTEYLFESSIVRYGRHGRFG